ncbi:MAG: PH domain-containing protein [Actinomycetota bacterium]
MWWTIWGAIVVVVGLASSPIAAESTLAGIGYAVGLVVAAAAAIAVPALRYRRWRYEIRERDLFLARGSLFFVLTLIPFDRIQYVETHQGPLDLAFGLMQLVVYTAAGRAARIPGLDRTAAASLREELAKVAGTKSV